MLAKLNLNKSQ